jgi:hypothetical protein
MNVVGLIAACFGALRQSSVGASALRLVGRAVAVVLLALGTGAAVAQDDASGTSADQAVIDYLSNLDAAKLDVLFKHVGIAPSAEFLDCLCAAGYHYFGTDGEPCRRTGPLGGVETRGLDMARSQSCAIAFPLADGRTVLEAVTEAAAKPGAEAAARVCRTFVADWSARRDALEERVRSGREALAAWMARKLKSDDIYRGKSWLWTVLWATFNAPFPQRDQGFKYDPGPLGANLNQDIGAFTCLNELFSRCEAAIGSGGAAESEPADARAQSAMGKYADELAADFSERAQQAFDRSIEIKDVLRGNPKEIRLSADANRESGYADMCRAAADDLERIGRGAPNPYSDDEPGDIPTTAAPFPRG